MGDVDLAHDLAERFKLCHDHAGTVATREKAMRHRVRHPGHGRKVLTHLAEQLAAQHCRWAGTRDPAAPPLPRERPTP